MTDSAQMSNAIEIYVRHSAERTLLNLYVPGELREKFLSALNEGSFADAETRIALELSVLPDWLTDGDVRKSARRTNLTPHARIPISQINVQWVSSETA